MPATVSHVLSATTPDDPAYEIKPSNWNSAHALTFNVLATEISALFSNKNGVSFGLDGTNITGSIAAGGAPGSVSAGTTNFALGEIVFSNSNGISFGLNGATVTAQHNALTTAMASNRGSDFVAATAAFAGTSASGTIASNGISVSIGPYITTAMLSNAATISNVRMSAGTTSNLLSAVTFADSNGLAFGLNAGTITGSYTVPTVTNSSMTVSDAATSGTLARLAFTNLNGMTLSLSTGAGGSHTVVGSYTVPTQSNQTLGFYGSSNTTLTSSGTFDARSMSVRGIGGVSVGYSNNEILISGPQTVAQSNQTVGIYASSNTTMTSSGTLDARSFSVRGAGIASVGYSNNELLISVPAGAPSPVNFSAGTTSGNLGSVVFSNANGVTFGLDGSTITASAAGGVQSNQTIGMYALGNTTQNSSSTFDARTVSLNGLGAMTVGYSNGSVQLSAPATSSLVGTNGISVSTGGSTISVMLSHMSSYENIPAPINASYSLNGASVSHAIAFQLFQPLSASFIRLPVSMTTASTTIATTATANANASGALYSTWNVVIYSMGTGANSQSLRSVTSTSFGATWMNSMSLTNTTQYSITQAFSFGNRGNGSTHTTQYSISNTNISLVSTLTVMHSQVSGLRLLDIPFAASLAPGNYWMVFGYSSSSATNSTAWTALTRCNVSYSTGGYISGSNVAFGEMGQTNMTSGGLFGAGSFSTAGGGTTASIPISAISSFASNLRPRFQMIRSA